MNELKIVVKVEKCSIRYSTNHSSYCEQHSVEEQNVVYRYGGHAV